MALESNSGSSSYSLLICVTLDECLHLSEHNHSAVPTRKYTLSAKVCSDFLYCSGYWGWGFL